MSQAIYDTITTPVRHSNPTAPQVMPITFEWSDENWVFAFVPGSDIAIILLHHDAAELERVVAGLSAFREQPRFARHRDCNGPDSCTEKSR
jgi:hypothetical protein